MKISLIAAMAKHRVIGLNNQMPWHLPADLKHFKAVTMGKTVVMGRRTYESIGRALPGRQNIVITRNSNYLLGDAQVVFSINEALTEAETEEIMIIGGEQLFTALLPKANRLYLTYINLDAEGDTFFPEFNPDEWQELENETHLADEKNPYDYRFITLTRK